MKVLCRRAAALFAGGDFGDYQNVRAITEPDGGVKKVLACLVGGYNSAIIIENIVR